MSPHAMMGRKTDGSLDEVAITDDGEVKISGTIEPAAGGATEAKQDEIIAALAGGLPLALGASGGLKIDGSGTPVPISATALPLPTGAATEAKQGGGMPAALHGGGGLKVGVLDSAGAEVFPAAAAPGSTNTNSATSAIAARAQYYDSNASAWRRGECSSSGYQYVNNVPKGPAQTIESTGTTFYEDVASSTSFALYFAFVTVDADGWILLVDKSAAAANGDAPVGGLSFKVYAGQTIEVSRAGGGVLRNFTNKCRFVFSSTQAEVTLAGNHMRVYARGD